MGASLLLSEQTLRRLENKTLRPQRATRGILEMLQFYFRRDYAVMNKCHSCALMQEQNFYHMPSRISFHWLPTIRTRHLEREGRHAQMKLAAKESLGRRQHPSSIESTIRARRPASPTDVPLPQSILLAAVDADDWKRPDLVLLPPSPPAHRFIYR